MLGLVDGAGKLQCEVGGSGEPVITEGRDHKGRFPVTSGPDPPPRGLLDRGRVSCEDFLTAPSRLCWSRIAGFALPLSWGVGGRGVSGGQGGQFWGPSELARVEGGLWQKVDSILASPVLPQLYGEGGVFIW